MGNYKLLFFIEDENDKAKRKTKRFNVYSKHSNDYLGKISWRCGWRCYVISYSEDIDMSVGCHEELNEFIKELEKQRLGALD